MPFDRDGDAGRHIVGDVRDQPASAALALDEDLVTVIDTAARGVGGRIRKQDVMAAVEAKTPQQAPPAAPAPQQAAEDFLRAAILAATQALS